ALHDHNGLAREGTAEDELSSRR
ncbi:MAG: hypothetical protein QOG89_614, partial [Thermomicrobiales bacterium]|nr:hypothetical protein [Thermomicrobiales bacterium]